MRAFLLTVSVLCAAVCAGLVWGWGFGIFDDRGWRQHSLGWLAMSVGAYVLAHHPVTTRIDEL